MFSIRLIILTGLILSLAIAGCGDEHDHDHDHPHGGAHTHKAPHGGTLIELKDHALFAEIVHDPETGKLQLYVLKNHAEDPLRIAQESIEVSIKIGGQSIGLSLKAVTDEVTQNRPGDSSLFEVMDQKLKATVTEITIKSVVVSGQSFNDKTAQMTADHDH
jgi:hypothetical protein